jgi:hypothetical protein
MNVCMHVCMQMRPWLQCCLLLFRCVVVYACMYLCMQFRLLTAVLFASFEVYDCAFFLYMSLTYMHTYIHTYTALLLHHPNEHVPYDTNTCVHTYTYTYLQTHPREHVPGDIQTCIHTYIHTYIHTQLLYSIILMNMFHTHTQTYIHTHICICIPTYTSW